MLPLPASPARDVVVEGGVVELERGGYSRGVSLET